MTNNFIPYIKYVELKPYLCYSTYSDVYSGNYAYDIVLEEPDTNIYKEQFRAFKDIRFAIHCTKILTGKQSDYKNPYNVTVEDYKEYISTYGLKDLKLKDYVAYKVKIKNLQNSRLKYEIDEAEHLQRCAQQTLFEINEAIKLENDKIEIENISISSKNIMIAEENLNISKLNRKLSQDCALFIEYNGVTYNNPCGDRACKKVGCKSAHICIPTPVELNWPWVGVVTNYCKICMGEK